MKKEKLILIISIIIVIILAVPFYLISVKQEPRLAAVARSAVQQCPVEISVPVTGDSYNIMHLQSSEPHPEICYKDYIISDEALQTLNSVCQASTQQVCSQAQPPAESGALFECIFNLDVVPCPSDCPYANFVSWEVPCEIETSTCDFQLGSCGNYNTYCWYKAEATAKGYRRYQCLGVA